MRGALLVIAAALAGALLTGLLIWRAHVNAGTVARTHQVIVQVCIRVHRLDLAIEQLVAVNSTRKVLVRTAYYRDHPAELAAALERARSSARILRNADCAAADLAVGAP